ncbi:hypothetical protein QVD17_02213 [Tagetes erecta]|uniref:Uncharacterized protein n=1 Tax=Tagetes erecta TaxID=13708 RepID=A0AAD8LB84_TARER|nr:hypothetical protein QVD17_02213 [Tagetes erecta]
MLDLNPQFYQNQNQNLNRQSNHRHRFNERSSGVQFRLETMEENSGVCSPPLWRSISPPDSPVRFPRSLSPASRAQAIARGQREMMEMVENMPETSYELSLKDMVEQRREFTDASVDETQSMEDGEQRLISEDKKQQRSKSKSKNVKRQESSKNGRIIVKTGSMNQNKGLLINMFFPFSIGSNSNNNKNKNKKMMSVSSRTNSYSYSGVKSSPTRELLEKSGDRRDWWDKVADTGYEESTGVISTNTSTSTSGESTDRSGSSGSSGSSGCSTAGSLHNNSDRRDGDSNQGCWSLFPFRKKKS